MAYLAFCRPSDKVFEILRDEYKRATERIGTWDPEGKFLADPDERLAEHLMVLYWKGKIDIDDQLLRTFWDRASEDLTAYAIKFVGHALQRTEKEIPPDILDRLRTLWERRLREAEESEHPEKFKREVASFGWWFISGKFDPKWTFDQLLSALKLSGTIDPSGLVVEKLAELAPDYPEESVRCLAALVDGEADYWEIDRWRKDAEKILSTAFENESPEVRELAEEIVHKLGAKGHIEFRKFLLEREDNKTP